MKIKQSGLSADVAKVLERIEVIAEALRAGEQLDASELLEVASYMRMVVAFSAENVSAFQLSNDDRAGLTEAARLLAAWAHPNQKEQPS